MKLRQAFNDEKYNTISQAAKGTGYTYQTVKKWAIDGDIPLLDENGTSIVKITEDNQRKVNEKCRIEHINKLNEISPDYTNQVLDKEKISTFLQDTKQVRFNFNEYTEGVSFITRILGIDTYMFFYEDFAENLDNNIQLFEKNNIPFTMHNILQYIKDEAGVRINVIVGNIMLVLFFLSLVVDGLILLFVVAMKKRWIDFDKKSIIFGEDI